MDAGLDVCVYNQRLPPSEGWPIASIAGWVVFIAGRFLPQQHCPH